MTKQQILELNSLSSGTISKELGSNSYNDVDNFRAWLFKPLLDDMWIGQTADFGDNILFALKNAISCYKRYCKRYASFNKFLHMENK